MAESGGPGPGETNGPSKASKPRPQAPAPRALPKNRPTDQGETMPILELTEAAATKAKKLLASSEFPSGALRVHVKDGGCSGQRYELLFDDDKRDDDDEFDQFGLTVRVDAESAKYLQGVTIDFSDALNDAGFKIDNPAAEAVCGCGESFSL